MTVIFTMCRNNFAMLCVSSVSVLVSLKLLQGRKKASLIIFRKNIYNEVLHDANDNITIKLARYIIRKRRNIVNNKFYL